jgi:hypothetical protein
MAKPLPRLPVAGVGGESPTTAGVGSKSPTISLSDDGWSKIEAACGRSFDSELRDAIRTRTKVYLRDAQFELNAKPLAPALDRLQRIRKAGARFQAELMRAPEPESARYANFLIKQNFADSRLKYGGPTDAIHAMHGVMASFVFVCARAEKGLEKDGFQRGETWNEWVRDLSGVLQKRGFRTSVRKDSDKSDTTSPFVRFIWELQELIPQEFRRGSHSDVALATLISKAIRGR